MHDRPQYVSRATNAGTTVTTPASALLVGMLGGHSRAGITLSDSEKRWIDRLYGYTPEPKRERGARPEPKPVEGSYEERAKIERANKRAEQAWEDWKDPSALMQAGADVNAFRHAAADGLRMVAWIARYLTPGDDPLKALVQLASGAGWDVDPSDLAWAIGDTEEDADTEDQEDADTAAE